MTSNESWLAVYRIFFVENLEQCVQKYSALDMKAYIRDGSNNTDGQTLHKASINKGKDLVHMFKKKVDIFI
jgi:hypothetical protein